MGIIKAINSRASIANVIRYITKTEKTDFKLIGSVNCSPDSAIEQMKLTKMLWNKTGGRQYKHFIQSFPPNEEITHEEAHKIAEELISNWDKFDGYEVIFATHKDREHIHTHIVVNSVSLETGEKFRYSKKELQDFKDLSDRILQKHNKTICIKNDEITAYKNKKYKAIEKSITNGKYKSYLLDCYKSVSTIRKSAVSREDFIEKMRLSGYETVWSNSRKYITFKDKNGNKVRNSNLEKTFKEQFGKEVLENEFKGNAERTTTTGQLDENIRKSIRERQVERISAEFERRKSDINTRNGKIKDALSSAEADNTRTIINNFNSAIADTRDEININELNKRNQSIDRESGKDETNRTAEQRIDRTKPKIKRRDR